MLGDVMHQTTFNVVVTENSSCLSPDLIQETDKSKRMPTTKAISKKRSQNNNLPQNISLERNLIKVPICVPHSKAARQQELVYELKGREVNGQLATPLFRMKNTGVGLPLPQHAKVLDVLIALLASNLNDEGYVWFTYAEIAHYLKIRGNDYSVIKEAIKRYHYNPMFFELIWQADKERIDSWGELLIPMTSLFNIEKKNSRRSKQREDKHYIQFHERIVDSLKRNYIRLFPREAFTDLDAGTYTLYKLFYAPTDKEPVRRTLTYIANFLSWSERTDRLAVWIVKHLEILKEKEFILWWKKKGECYEVQGNNAKFKHSIESLRRLQPKMAADKKILKVKETGKLGKLKGDVTIKDTHDAVAFASKKQELQSKKVRVEKIKIEAPEGDLLMASLSKMPMERQLFFIDLLAKMSPLMREQYTQKIISGAYGN